MNATVDSTILSPAQRAVLELACLSGRGCPPNAILDRTEASLNTVVSLVGLGLITRRQAGGRDALYHLTPLGRAFVCGDDPGDALRVPGQTATTLDQGGTTMATKAKNETKTTGAAKKRGMTGQIEEVKPDAAVAEAQAAAEDAPGATPEVEDAAAVPPVEDVTGQKPEDTSKALKAVYDALVKQVKATIRGNTVVQKSKYVRILSKEGKTVGFVNEPTRKHVVVEVPKPKGQGSGYLAVKVTNEAEIPGALAVVQNHIDTVLNAPAPAAAEETAAA